MTWKKHKKLTLAILGSLLIHVLVLFIFALASRHSAVDSPLAEPPKPLRLQIVEEEKKKEDLVPAAMPTPTPRVHRRNLDTSDLAQAGTPPPADTLMESDKDTAARSELAPTGTDALPSQNGREIPQFMFDTHAAAAGNPASAAASAARAAENNPPAPVATPLPETAPPLPHPDLQAAAATPAPAANALPIATVASTPPPAPTPDEFAALQGTPTPKPVDFDPFTRQPQTEPPKPTPVAEAAAATPADSRNDATKTLMRGNLTNLGPTSSMAALATPQGRYNRAVSEAIRTRWLAHINASADVASFGTVKIHFSVDRRGKVLAPHVISNSGNAALASISLGAILEAVIPPVPEEVASTNKSPDLPLDFDFSLY